MNNQRTAQAKDARQPNRLGSHLYALAKRTNDLFRWLTVVGVMMIPTGLLAAVQTLDSIVAVVDDEVITRYQLDQEIAALLPQLAASGTATPGQARLEQQVLNRLILKRLQLRRAQQLGLTVDEPTLTQALERIAQRNGLSLAQLQQTLTASGLDFAAFREDTRNQVLIAQLQNQEVVKTIQVSEPEIDRFLAQEADSLIQRTEVQLQHILIALPEAPSPQQVHAAEAKVRNILQRLRRGESFAKLAIAYSDGRRALDGGDLGWFPIAEVPSLAATLARSLKKGEVSEAIRSSSGLHILKLTNFRGIEPQPQQQTHVRHILLRTNELRSDSEAQQRLKTIRQRIINGDDFSELARAYSDDTGSALKGGDLGWVNPGATVPNFEAVMNRSDVNTVSQPFKSPFGWHILQVLERRKQETATAVMRSQAAEALRARKSDDAIELWLRRLRDEAYVEIRLPNNDDAE
jgi:peptidyl-prolyl cis-trans isomerase SurA